MRPRTGQHGTRTWYIKRAPIEAPQRWRNGTMVGVYYMISPFFFSDVISGGIRALWGWPGWSNHERTAGRPCATRPDRLGRSWHGFLETVENLKLHGIHLDSLEEKIDTASTSGEPVFRVFGAIAHFAHRRIAECTRDGMASARKQDRHLGRPRLKKAAVPAVTKLVEAGISPGEVAERFGIGRATAYNIAGKLQAS